MKVTVLSTVGNGQQGETLLAEGTTVQDVCLNCLGVDPTTKELSIRINGLQGELGTVLSDGDRIAVAPRKIANA